MALAIIFGIVFVLGPALFHGLIRPRPSVRQFRALIAIMLGCVALSFVLRFVPAPWGASAAQIALSMVLIWVAWIAILALLVQRLRGLDPRPPMHRWSAIFGAIGTTIPWFGLASARMMTA